MYSGLVYNRVVLWSNVLHFLFEEDYSQIKIDVMNINLEYLIV